MKYVRTTVMMLVFAAAATAAGAAEMVMRAPARDQYPTQNPEGTSILPNGRLITPSGAMFRVRHTRISQKRAISRSNFPRFCKIRKL